MIHLDGGQTLALSMGRTSLWDLAGVDSEQAKRGPALSLLSFKEKKNKTEDIGHTHLHIVAQYRGRILIEEKADSHKLLDTLSL